MFQLTSSSFVLFILITEFILLSDTLGVSALINLINNARPPGATEAAILGPFYAEDAHESKDLIVVLNILFLIRFATVEKGDLIASEGKGDYMFVDGVVKVRQHVYWPGLLTYTFTSKFALSNCSALFFNFNLSISSGTRI